MPRLTRTHEALRQRLLGKGFSQLPRCPEFRIAVALLQFAAHTRQCERDNASRTLEACDRALARLWSTEPTDANHQAAMDDLDARLRYERAQAHNLLCGLDAFGRGRIVTTAPGWPHDGFEI